MNGEIPNDLDWVAFQYLVDELAPDECAAFERRLGEDTEACEAVARAVELSSAVYAIQSDHEAVQRVELSKPSKRRSQIVAGFSLALVVFLIAGLFHENTDSGSPEDAEALAESESSAAPELAIAWFDMDDEMEFNENDRLLTQGNGAAEPQAEEDLAAPDWLISALAAKARRTENLSDEHSATDES